MQTFLATVGAAFLAGVVAVAVLAVAGQLLRRRARRRAGQPGQAAGDLHPSIAVPPGHYGMTVKLPDRAVVEGSVAVVAYSTEDASRYVVSTRGQLGKAELVGMAVLAAMDLANAEVIG